MKAYGRDRYVGVHKVCEFYDNGDLVLLGLGRRSRHTTRRLQRKNERAAVRREILREVR